MTENNFRNTESWIRLLITHERWPSALTTDKLSPCDHATGFLVIYNNMVKNQTCFLICTLQVFPTVKDMRKAADCRPNKDDIVSEIKFGFGRRKIGIAASRVVGGLFSDSPLHWVVGLEEKGKCCNTLGFKIEVTKWIYKVGDFRVSDMVGINYFIF